MELFPPLTRSLRLQLRDDAPLADVALATHVLDLRQISNSGRAGEHIWPTGGLVYRGSGQLLRTKLILRTQVAQGEPSPHKTNFLNQLCLLTMIPL